MQITEWIRSRETPGTIANGARRILESGKTYRATEKMIRSMYILEALMKHGGNQGLAAKAIGVTPGTVQRVLRSLGLRCSDVRRIAGHIQGATDASRTAER